MRQRIASRYIFMLLFILTQLLLPITLINQTLLVVELDEATLLIFQQALTPAIDIGRVGALLRRKYSSYSILPI